MIAESLKTPNVIAAYMMYIFINAFYFYLKINASKNQQSHYRGAGAIQICIYQFKHRIYMVWFVFIVDNKIEAAHTSEKPENMCRRDCHIQMYRSCV